MTVLDDIHNYETLKRVECYLMQLYEQYSPDYTDDDYRKLVQGMTCDSELVELTLKAWAEVLISLEGKGEKESYGYGSANSS